MTHLSPSSQSFPDLLPSPIPSPSAVCGSSGLDLTAILQASQALSSAIEINKLFSILLHAVIQMTGATKCALILLDNDDLRVQATAQPTASGQIEIQMPSTPMTVQDGGPVPIGLVEQVRQRRQPVVILDATAPLPIGDRDFLGPQPPSLLCIPILRQGELLGMVYLEKQRAVGALTHDHLELLQLLCAQTAISLENARLYHQSQQALAQLQENETRFENLVANIPGMVYRFCRDADGSTSTPYVSSGCVDLYEVAPEDLMTGRYSAYAMHHPEDHAAIEQALRDSAETLTPFMHEWRIITPSGKVKWIQSVARPQKKADGAIVWDGFVVDVTARKQIEAERQQVEVALRRSEERYRSLINVTSQIVWIATPDGRTVESPNWCTYTGQSLEKLKEFGWLEALHPEDSEHTGRIWNHARETRTWYKTEYRIRGADGSYRYFDVKGVPILAEDGSIREWIGSCTDIDDRKQAEAALHQRTIELEHTLQELQRTQTQMVQAEKMSSLGQLVAGVAHEINNPVNFIYGNLNHADSYTQDLLRLLDLYQRHYPMPHPEIQQEAEEIDLDFLREDLPQLLASMKVGANRIRTIVASLRNFSRMDEAEMKAVNIHDGIDSTLMILKHRLKAKEESPGIEVIKDYGELPLVECYAGQLNQVFMNLLSNAIDSLEEAFAQHKITDPTITIATTLVNAEEISISITDNGLGIPAAVKQRLFNPFFTTKPVGKGTGMGLSISYQVVTEKHRGRLSCDSNPETGAPGATFTVTIPTHQG